MSWTKPTRDDLTATVSAEEVDAFGDSADFADAVSGILSRTTNLVRGYVRAGGAKVPAEPGTIPPSLLAPAMDYAAFDLLKRFNIPVSEDRRKARAEKNWAESDRIRDLLASFGITVKDTKEGATWTLE